MAHFITGPAGGPSESRELGTKVKLAGRTTYLPNEEAPVLFLRLTMSQIAAIPKDRYAVSLVESAGVPGLPTVSGIGHKGSHKGHGYLSAREIQRLVNLARLPGKSRGKAAGFRSGKGKAAGYGSGNLIGYIRKPSATVKQVDDGTKEYNTMVTLIEQIREKADSLYDTNLALSRNQRETPPDSGLFYPPIDDGCMVDCIKKALAHFFGENDTYKLNGAEYKPAAFCLLMHDYFIRIHILKNTSRTPFCDFLQKRVLRGDMQFSSRTFTNYANEYKNLEKDFTEPSRQKFNFNVHPEPTGKVQDAFHEIGHFFHTSNYFTCLRVMRNNVGTFLI